MHRLLCVALFLSAAPAVAQAPKVKTGYEVPGCTYYRLAQTKVIPICDLRSVTEKGPTGQAMIWETQTATLGGSNAAR